MNVVIVFLQGGLASTAIAPLEIFKSAGVLWNLLHGIETNSLFNVQTTSIDCKNISSGNSVSLMPDSAISSIRKVDLIVIPAMGLNTEKSIVRCAKLIPWLRKWHERGTPIAGICTGVALLAEAGILDGKNATTHWGVLDEYKERYPAVNWRPELFITEEDDVYCGGGVYASIDLSLYLVEKYSGHDIANKCAKALLIDRPRISQTSYSSPLCRVDHDDEKILEAQKWIQKNYKNNFHFDDVASIIGMSPRNFSRRFKKALSMTPLRYLQNLRITEAKRHLEKAHKTVHEISANVGYKDTIYFRNLFKRQVGISPTNYRSRFGS